MTYKGFESKQKHAEAQGLFQNSRHTRVFLSHLQFSIHDSRVKKPFARRFRSAADIYTSHNSPIFNFPSFPLS